MSPRPNSLAAKDAAFHFHGYTNALKNEKDGGFVVTRGKGVYIYDEDGKEYMDGLAGLWCCSLGFGEVPRLTQAIVAQMQVLPLLPHLHAEDGGGHDRAGGEAGEPGAGSDVQGLFLQLRLRGQRHRHQDGALPEQWPRAPAEEKDHLAGQGLSRRHHRRRIADRPAGDPQGFRPADRRHPPHRLPAPLPLRPAGRDRGAVRHPLRREPGKADPGRRA